VIEGRSFAHPYREVQYTDIVYGGPEAPAYGESMRLLSERNQPTATPYNIYWGEIHGHTEISDGGGSLDDYFTAARDTARLDFCAVTDHDHGGVAKPELWGDKWELTQQKVAEYHDSGKFVTLLGYERDSWPWYTNLCLYYRDGRGEMVRGVQDGEITREELTVLLARDDMIVIPHHTSDTGQGVNFDCIPPELMTPLIEVYSKWGTSEYFGNPRPVRRESRSGHWRDALEMGAKMGCVGGSDVHGPYPGIKHRAGGNLRHDNPGIVAVLAPELTREAVFDAIKARRCYGASGARIAIEFRVNNAVMGEEIETPRGEERKIFYNVVGEAPLERVDLIKNGRDYFVEHTAGESNRVEFSIADLRAERETDYYYVRATQEDGRQAWSSPIWVQATD
jgi:hypothetical protein